MSRQSRFLTYLFCDLVDSTGLIARHDSETAFELIDEFRTVCRRQVELHQGFVASSMGDGVLACFGYPLALESHVEAACRCALSLVQTVKALSRPLQVRIGIASGRGVLDLRQLENGKAEIAAVSSAANLGARLQAEAAPGQIVVSAQVREQLQGLFEFRDERKVLLKGFDQPQTICLLSGYGSYRSQSHQRGEAQPIELVGRDDELREVLAAWQATVREGRGRSMLVRGPGGIGKSTLLRAIKLRTADRARAITLYSAWFEQHTALHPFRTCLEDLLSRQPAEFLEQWLRRYLQGERLAEGLELISILLGRADNTRWPPNILRTKILNCLTRLMLELSREKPLLVIVEDAHWLDPSSAEVLERLQAHYALFPIFVLGSARPRSSGAETQRWEHTIDLARLQDPDVSALISGLDPQLRLNDEVRREIARKAEGVPLLIREFTRATLVPAGDGEQRLVVPDTLLDSFVAQLDSWAAVKDLLDVAAAVGGSFSARLLAAALGRSEPEVAEVLQRMVAVRLLNSYRGPDGEPLFDFSHALLRDAAFATLLPKQRRDIHAKVLQAWQAIDAQFAQSHPNLAAHHLEGIGNYAEAIQTLLAGAQVRFMRSQFSEAGGLIRKALRLMPEIQPPEAQPALELQLQTLLGLTLTQLMGFGDEAVNQAFSRAWDICKKLDTSGEPEFQAIWGIWAHKLVVSETATAVELVDALDGIGRRSGKAELDMLTRSASAVMRFITGAFAGVQPEVDAVRQNYRLAQHRHLALAYSNDPLAMALMFHTHALAARGEIAAAERCRGEVLGLADELGVEFLLPYIRIWSWGSALYHGTPDGIIEVLDQAIALAERLGIAFWVSGGTLWKAHAYVGLGQPEKAIHHFDEGLGVATQIGMRFTLSYFHGLHAWALARTGHAAAALPIFNECLRQNRASGELCYHAEIHRLYGEALLHADANARPQALRQFAQGLAVARSQQAGGWERKILQSLQDFGFDDGQEIELVTA